MIAIPDSVSFYRADAVNRAALDALMISKGVPRDLSLAEAERYELAALAAQRVRVEHWTTLRALWAATWGEAVRAHLPAARLMSYGEHRAFAAEVHEDAEPSVDAAWENQGTCGVFELRGVGRLYTALWFVESETEVQLQFYLIDEDGDCTISDDLDLGPEWGEDDDNRRETVVGRLPFAITDAGIDPEPAAVVARTAVAALAEALG